MRCWQSILVLLFLAAPLAIAQNPALSASAGIGPWNSFTLFLTLQDPMPKIDSIWCGFNLVGAPSPGQEDLALSFNCVGAPKKDDDTHYRVEVGVPLGIAAGDYKITQINFSVGSAAHIYRSQDLPGLAPVQISNPEHLRFSPIKRLEVRP